MKIVLSESEVENIVLEYVKSKGVDTLLVDFKWSMYDSNELISIILKDE